MIDGMKRYIARGLMAGLCLLWIVFGILTLENSVILAILLVLNGVIFGFFAFVCKAKNRLIKWLLYVFIGANIILTFTDQMGFFDWMVLVLYVLLLGFLIMEHRDSKESST